MIAEAALAAPAACVSRHDHASEPFLLPGAMCDNGLLVRVPRRQVRRRDAAEPAVRTVRPRGVSLGTNVLSGWVGQSFREARPLFAALMAQVAQADVMQGDDSGLPVQDGTDGKVTHGRIWVVSDRRQAFFAFSRTKEGSTLQSSSPSSASRDGASSPTGAPSTTWPNGACS
ncbi:MAG: transposase [Myxococcota bacterium]